MTAPHRMLQDILAQADSLERLLEYQSGEGRPMLERAADAIQSAKKVVITGMGASLYTAMSMAFRLQTSGRAAIVIESGDLLHFGGELARDSVVIAVSRSGETVEILRLLPQLVKAGAFVVGITNEPGTSLARDANIPVLVHSMRDESVAVQTYTGTTTVSLILAALVAGENPWAGAAAVPGLLRCTLSEERSTMETWAQFFRGASVVYILARGASVASACEGALLLNETAKLPSVALPAGGFRHGPVEVVNEEFRGVLLSSDSRSRALDDALSSSLARMGGLVRMIHAQEGTFAPVIEIVPLQFAAYAAALDRGVVPGRFRYVSVVTTSETEFGGNAG